MFSKLLTSLRVGIGRTENGAITNESSSNHCLDLFFIAGASRNIPEMEIVRLFSLALSEDQHTTLKILFWARDIRGGAGERRFFRYCWNYLVKLHPDIIVHLIEYVPVYGRWDDLFETLYYPEILEQVCTALRNGDSLACKWAPRKGPIAELLTKGLKLSPKQYRRLIVANTKVVETQMCNNKWGGNRIQKDSLWRNE